ncbi:MAG: hypothetical protein K0U12_06595 [Gammaproteobacteria bacterium]|nr:hypothetical protein [Gammaproteobacteria bacterium]
MTSLISIRLNDELLKEMRAKACVLHLSQTDDIRKAIKLMNHEIEKQERNKRLKQVSLRVREERFRSSN